LELVELHDNFAKPHGPLDHASFCTRV